MKSKEAQQNEMQRYQIAFHSIFGIWSDLSDSIVFRIIPARGTIRLKIEDVRSPDTMNRIVSFCGGEQMPRRKVWEGFDLISDLTKHMPNLYVDGKVHMPNAKRRNKVRLTLMDEALIKLHFFFDDPQSGKDIPSGEILLKKNYEKKLFKA